MTGKLSEASHDVRVPAASFASDMVHRLTEEAINPHLFERENAGRVVIDSRGEVEGAFFLGLPGENHDGSSFAGDALDKGAKGVVVNENVWEMIKLKARKMGKAAILVRDPLFFFGELARHRRRRIGGTKFIGITGSTGKTTTKDMIYNILAKTGKTFKNPGNYNNLIGLPLSVLMIKEEDEYAVLEMGTNTPGEIGRLTEILSPHVGAITNIGPAHLEGLGGVDGVKKEKGDLFRNLDRDAVAVINGDDLRVRVISDVHSGKKVFFGEKGGEVTGKIIELTPDGMRILLRYGPDEIDVTMNCSGLQFFKNALCAAGVTFVLGISPHDVESGLSTFQPDEGRFQIYKLADDIVLVDDTYNSNPLSVEVAVDNLRKIFPGRKILFLLGDMLELGEAAESSHLRIGDLSSSLNPHRIFTYGDLARKIREGALNAGYPESRCHHIDDIDALGKKIIEDIAPETVILVKGSRMMRLERIAVKIIDRFSVKGE